ncbi:MAG: hypothetical protein ACIAQF_09955 [Phycisphaerales bacterium JB065]
MLKFLRKYNMLILVVGGSLLMIAFLVPQAIQQFGQKPSNIPYARIDGEVVSYQDFQEAAKDWQLVNQVLGEAVRTLQIQDVDHWMLLLHEAEKYGLVGGPTDGASSMNFFADYAAKSSILQLMQMQPFMFQNNDQVMQAVQSQTEFFHSRFLSNLELATSGGTPELFFYRAIAKLRGIARLLETYNSLAGNSIPEIQLAAADLYDRVTADIGIIPASAFRPEPASLDPQAVQEHFETYRDIAAGEGDFGFGYLLPDGLKYELLRVNASAILESLDAEPADLLEYFRRNQSDYGSQTFEEARSRVRTDYLNSLAQQRIQKIAADVSREITRAEQTLDKDSSAERYRVVPEGYVGPALETYAEVARESSGLEGEAADSLITIFPVTEEFQNEADLRTSQFGATRFEITANEHINFAFVLLGAKEFAADDRMDIQRGLLFGPLVSPVSGGVDDLLFVRITETRNEGPAESVAEVEDQVREDLATLRGYEELSQRADTFREAFADGGLTWFNSMRFAGHEDSRQYLDVTIGLETVQTSSGDELIELRDSDFPEGVISKARSLNPLIPIEEQPADARTAGVLMPSNLSLGLAAIKSYRPTTQERLREGSSVIMDRVTRQARGLSTEAPYTFEALSRRLGFERLNVNEEDEE